VHRSCVAGEEQNCSHPAAGRRQGDVQGRRGDLPVPPRHTPAGAAEASHSLVRHLPSLPPRTRTTQSLQLAFFVVTVYTSFIVNYTSFEYLGDFYNKIINTFVKGHELVLTKPTNTVPQQSAYSEVYG